MARFTKALRQRIIQEFTENNGGFFDPAGFVAHVHDTGPEHDAYEWFEWDDDKAAHEYRLDQARDFIRGLTVRFEVQTIHRGAFKVVENSMPLMMSALESRKSGGGYYTCDPNDPEHMEQLRRQAAQSLRWFLSRYNAALTDVGVNLATLENVQSALEHHAEHEKAA